MSTLNVLVIDVGGTHVKILATGETNRREFVSLAENAGALFAEGRGIECLVQETRAHCRYGKGGEIHIARSASRSPRFL